MGTKANLANSYRDFSAAEGNAHISSEFAIRKLQELISTFKVDSVLELGLGIGSIAGSLLAANERLKYSGTETDQFCLKELPKNLKGEFARLTVLKNIMEVPSERKFDLLIIDGDKDNIKVLERFLNKNGIIAIEGDRDIQVQVLKEQFPRGKFVHSISLEKNKPYSPFSSEEWQGGIKIIFKEPSFTQRIWWFKEKVLTKFKYKIPGRYLGSKNKI